MIRTDKPLEVQMFNALLNWEIEWRLARIAQLREHIREIRSGATDGAWVEAMPDRDPGLDIN